MFAVRSRPHIRVSSALYGLWRTSSLVSRNKTRHDERRDDDLDGWHASGCAMPRDPDCAPATVYTVLMPSCISGIERSRLPVAAKIALSTAGAATDTVGSPTPPQKPPDGITITSTRGISRMRSEL